MRIQSKKVWIADQFTEAVIEIQKERSPASFHTEAGPQILIMETCALFPDFWTSTATAPMNLTPMTPMKRDCAAGQKTSSLKV